MKRNQIQIWTTKAIEKEEQNRSSRPGEENKIATDISKTQTKKLKSNQKRKIQNNRENEKEPKTKLKALGIKTNTKVKTQRRQDKQLLLRSFCLLLLVIFIVFDVTSFCHLGVSGYKDWCYSLARIVH